MRNFSILLCIVLSLNACKKSSNNSTVTPALLSGRWIEQSYIIKSYTNGVLSNTTSATLDTGVSVLSSLAIVIDFNANLSGTYFEPGINGLGFTYSISGNNLIYNFSIAADLPTIVVIKSFTKTQLELIDGTASGNGFVHDIIYVKE